MIHNTVDHQIVTHTAQLDDLCGAQKAGSTTKMLLIESPCDSRPPLTSRSTFRTRPAAGRPTFSS
ncbi:hypothetical protein CA982_05455 [Gordonia lacunae]|uniref:Uncharacterized protein n=1 Tax=Gordonia lacunae TaxID=417102 RepID=A0A243QER3_9ACTN|nr:hypothetical protein CA982_05455 [Gordonia lacunae]